MIGPCSDTVVSSDAIGDSPEHCDVVLRPQSGSAARVTEPAPGLLMAIRFKLSGPAPNPIHDESHVGKAPLFSA